MFDNTDDYQNIFIKNAPMIDLRAPIEFIKGAFPFSHNLPLMSDSEREAVGTCYKNQGQDAAIRLGHQLVSGSIREERLQRWIDYIHANPTGYLYCFRGGLRSRTVQEWLNTAAIQYPRVIGGYKALRNFLIEKLEHNIQAHTFIVLDGLTGSGKTDVLNLLPNTIDLEAHAHHRGSSFGKRVQKQPTQINFENTLSIDLLKKCDSGTQKFIIENESKSIGRISLPLTLYTKMQTAPLVFLETPFEARVQQIIQDYIIGLSTEFIQSMGLPMGFDAFVTHLKGSLKNLTQRLGYENYTCLARMMDQALVTQEKTGSIESHFGWISKLLTIYYDPLYHYHRAQKMERTIFSGNRHDIIEFLTK